LGQFHLVIGQIHGRDVTTELFSGFVNVVDELLAALIFGMRLACKYELKGTHFIGSLLEAIQVPEYEVGPFVGRGSAGKPNGKDVPFKANRGLLVDEFNEFVFADLVCLVQLF
jgi:hypothetical protein